MSNIGVKPKFFSLYRVNSSPLDTFNRELCCGDECDHWSLSASAASPHTVWATLWHKCTTMVRISFDLQSCHLTSIRPGSDWDHDSAEVRKTVRSIQPDLEQTLDDMLRDFDPTAPRVARTSTAATAAAAAVTAEWAAQRAAARKAAAAAVHKLDTSALGALSSDICCGDEKYDKWVLQIQQHQPHMVKAILNHNGFEQLVLHYNSANQLIEKVNIGKDSSDLHNYDNTSQYYCRAIRPIRPKLQAAMIAICRAYRPQPPPAAATADAVAEPLAQAFAAAAAPNSTLQPSTALQTPAVAQCLAALPPTSAAASTVAVTLSARAPAAATTAAANSTNSMRLWTPAAAAPTTAVGGGHANLPLYPTSAPAAAVNVAKWTPAGGGLSRLAGAFVTAAGEPPAAKRARIAAEIADIELFLANSDGWGL